MIGPAALLVDVDFAVQPASAPGRLLVDVDFAVQGIAPVSEWAVLAIDADFQVELDTNQSLSAIKFADELVLVRLYRRVGGSLIDLVNGEELAP